MIARVLAVLLLLGCEADDDPAPPPVVPPQPAQVMITVAASSVPTGAHVTGGGRPLGTTPLTVQVPVPPPQPGVAQTFAFTFAMPGYQAVTVNAAPINNTISVNATLTPIGSTPVPPAPPAPVVVAPQPSGELTEADARRQIPRYYASRSEWAGQYVMTGIQRIRMERRGDRVEAHARYGYRCLQPRCAGADNGMDQRVFYFERRAGDWRIVRMGDHMSAQL